MVALSSGIGTRYNLGPVKPWVEAAAYYLGPKYNITTIYGWRKTDPFPDHPSGHALDFMTDIPNGNALADDAIAHASQLGVKYIIHNHQAWDPQIGWHPYTSTSNPHTDHVHITFNDSPGTAFINGSLASLGVGGTFTSSSDSSTQQASTASNTCAWQLNLTVSNPCVITKSALRGLIGGVLIGAAMIVGIVGVVVLVANSFGDSAVSAIPGAGTVVGIASKVTG